MEKAGELMQKIKNAPDKVTKGMSRDDIYRSGVKQLMMKGHNFNDAEFLTVRQMVDRLGRGSAGRALCSASPRFYSSSELSKKALAFCNKAVAENRKDEILKFPGEDFDLSKAQREARQSDGYNPEKLLEDKFKVLAKSYYLAFGSKNMPKAEYEAISDIMSKKFRIELVYGFFCKKSSHMAGLDDNSKGDFFRNCEGRALAKVTRSSNPEVEKDAPIFDEFCSNNEEFRLMGYDMEEARMKTIASFVRRDYELDVVFSLIHKFDFDNERKAYSYIDHCMENFDNPRYVRQLDNSDCAVQPLDENFLFRGIHNVFDRFSECSVSVRNINSEYDAKTPSKEWDDFHTKQGDFILSLYDFCKDIKFRCGYDFEVSKVTDDFYNKMSNFNHFEFSKRDLNSLHKVITDFKKGVSDFVKRDITERIDKEKSFRKDKILNADKFNDSYYIDDNRFISLAKQNLEKGLDMHRALMASTLELIKSGVSSKDLEDTLLRVSPECITRADARKIVDKVSEHYHKVKLPILDNKESVNKVVKDKSKGNEGR